MATSGDDLVANSFKDPNSQSNISTGAGDDYIWTNIFVPVMHIDGGEGFYYLRIPDGWLGGFTIEKTFDGYLLDYLVGRNLFDITNVELIIIAAADAPTRSLKTHIFHLKTTL